MRIKGRKNKRLEFDMNDQDFDRWCDKDHLMFVTMMKLNERFVEDEINANIVDWSSDPAHQHAHDEFVKVYKFWKNHKKYVDRIDDMYLGEEWYGKTGWVDEEGVKYSWDDINKIPKGNGLLQYEHYNPLGLNSPYQVYEEKIRQLEDQMMQRLIDVRGFMWT